MILTQQQIDILTSKQHYDCSLVKQKWSYTILKEDVSPLGNILTFETPINISKFCLDSSIVIAAELPNVNMFGGASFLRLYSTQLGSILSHMLNKDCYVDQSCVFIEEQQASISLLNHVKESILFHIIFSTCFHKHVFELKMTQEEKTLFQEKAIDCFHHLVKSIFIETRRDNI